MQNGLEYTWLLRFFASMQFMNSSLDIFVKNLPDNDLKYLPQGFPVDLLKLVKQKGMYRYEYMDNLKIFFKDKLPDR